MAQQPLQLDPKNQSQSLLYHCKFFGSSSTFLFLFWKGNRSLFRRQWLSHQPCLFTFSPASMESIAWPSTMVAEKIQRLFKMQNVVSHMFQAAIFLVQQKYSVGRSKLCNFKVRLINVLCSYSLSHSSPSETPWGCNLLLDLSCGWFITSLQTCSTSSALAACG